MSSCFHVSRDVVLTASPLLDDLNQVRHFKNPKISDLNHSKGHDFYQKFKHSTKFVYLHNT